MFKIIGGDQKEYGPVTADEVRRWIAEGRLNGQSLIQDQTTVEWRALASFAEFTDALQAQAGSAVPPPGVPMPPVSAEIWMKQILAQQPQVQISRCLADSWNLLRANFGLFLGGTFVVWLVGTLCSFVPFGIGSLVYLTLRGVLYGGLFLIFLNRIRGKPAAVADVFAGFNIAFAQLVLVGLVSGILTAIAFAPCCLVIPGLYLFVAWKFSVPLVADRRLEFWSAMELSRKVVTRVWFEILGLMLLAFLPSILMFLFVQVQVFASMIGPLRELMTASRPDFTRMMELAFEVAKTSLPLILLSKAVVLFNMPFALGALMYAYEDLFGPRTTPTI